MTYMIKRGGQESGPFTLEQMKKMCASGEIDDATMFRPCGSDHWFAAVDLEGELSGSPPPLPEQSFQKLAEPSAVLGWSTAKWIAASIALIVGLGAINYAINHKEIARRLEEQKADRAAREAEEVVQAQRRDEIWKVKELGRRLGKSDGQEIGASGMRKPSLDEIRFLCVGHGTRHGIDKMDKERIAEFWLAYEAAFKKAYKSTADW